MNRAASWLTLLGVAACAPSAQPPPPAPAAPCEAALEGPVELSEGGRRTVALRLSEAVAGWSVADPGPFTARAEGDRLELRAPYELGGDFAVQLALQCGDRQGSLRVPARIRRLKWSRLSTWTEGVDGPLAREYGAFWVDPTGADRALLYGGFVYRPKQFTPATDAWRLELSTGAWSPEPISGTPPAATGGRVAARPGSPEVLYLGGVTSQGETPYVLAKLAPSGSALAWSDAAAAGGSGDYQPGFFYDPRRDRYLSLCGANASVGWHCELRALEAGAWKGVPTAGPAPQGRNGHFYVYDAEHDRAILFGGDANGSTLGDTWSLELSESPPRWVRLADDPSLRRRNGAWVLDEQNRRLVMWGGTQDGATSVKGLWMLSLERGEERWIQPAALEAPPDRASGVAIYDARRERMVAGLGNSEAGVFADLWALQL